MVTDTFGYLLVLFVGVVLFPFLVNVAAALTTPWIRARLEEIGSWYGRWSNDQRTKSLAALDKEEAQIRSLHDDPAALLRYMSFHVLGFLHALVLGALYVFLVGYATPFTWDSLFGMSAERTVRVLTIGSTTVFLGMALAWLQRAFGRISNVYRFETWERYVAKRRSQLTKVGDSNS